MLESKLLAFIGGSLLIAPVVSAQSASWDNILAISQPNDFLSAVEKELPTWPVIDSVQKNLELSGADIPEQRDLRAVSIRLADKLVQIRQTTLDLPAADFETAARHLRSMQDALAQRPSYVKLLLRDFLERYAAILCERRALDRPAERAAVQRLLAQVALAPRTPEMYSAAALRENLIDSDVITDPQLLAMATQSGWDTDAATMTQNHLILSVMVIADRVRTKASADTQAAWQTDDTPNLYGSTAQLIQKRRPAGFFIQIADTWTITDLLAPLAADLLNRFPEKATLLVSDYAAIKQRTANLTALKFGTDKDPFQGPPEILAAIRLLASLGTAAGFAGLMNTQGTVGVLVPCPVTLGSLSPPTLPAAGGAGTVTVTAAAGCLWTIIGGAPWISFSNASTGIGSGTLKFSALANVSALRSATVTLNDQTFTISQTAPAASTAGLAFYPVTPCRIADTRAALGFTGAFGPPSMPGLSTRTFPILSSACGIPSTAVVYSLNFTVVPPANGPQANLTTWPTGLTSGMPNVSTLNYSSKVVANAAIVPAGTNGSIDVFVNYPTDVLFDINGYFAPPIASGLDFFPITPCRIADTRGLGFTGSFGPPSMGALTTRPFDPTASPCGIPSTASAYSLNFTVVPPSNGPQANLTTWPASQPSMPNVSTLNYAGKVVANAAIVPAGTTHAIDVFVNYPTDVLFDTNGYFGPPAASGLHFYPVTPCRIADTRAALGYTGAFGPPSMGALSTRTFNIPSSACGIPSTAVAYSLNFTVVPPSNGQQANLTTWPTGLVSGMPNVSTLNYAGTVVANAAIVPAGTNGSINVFVNFATDVLFDINGYFAP